MLAFRLRLRLTMADKPSDDSGIHSSIALIPLYYYCVNNMSRTAQTVDVMIWRTKSELSSFTVDTKAVLELFVKPAFVLSPSLSSTCKIKEHIGMNCTSIQTTCCL